MKKTFKTIICTLIILSNLIGFCVLANENANINVSLKDQNKNNINGLNISIIQVAKNNGDEYTLTKNFKNLGIPITQIKESTEDGTANKVLEYAKENEITAAESVSKNGEVVFSSLNKGIYLVYCNENQKYTFLPYFANTNTHTKPKVEKAEVFEELKINVIKRFDDNNMTEKRPKSVTIHLKRDGKKIKTAKLSSGNAWSHTFKTEKVDGKHKYTVVEDKTDYYTPSYKGNIEDGFIITNVYMGDKLPQTGVQVLPILIILVIGAAFILLGIIEIKVNKNENE